MTMKKRAPKQVAVNYQNGKIYKIVNTINGFIYIGSTTSTLPKRFCSHKSSTNMSKLHEAMKTLGAENFQIILIELFPCTCKSELEAREYKVMNTYDKATLLNSIFNGAPDAETALKIKAAKAITQKRGADHSKFNRGSISHRVSNGSYSWRFNWMENGKIKEKSYAFGKMRTREAAYMLCLAQRDLIYPLQNQDYLAELPFTQ